MQTKDQLRTTLRTARRTRSAAELAAARDAVRAHVLDRLAGAACVAAYEPLPTEPGSVELLAQLHAGGVRVLVPITLPDRDLDWAQWLPGGPGSPLGVGAVSAAQLVLAPALAAGMDGTRLGRGGGSYDRALARCSAGAITAALVFADELLASVPRDPWDVPVDFAVTPAGWQRLGRNTDVGDTR